MVLSIEEFRSLERRKCAPVVATLLVATALHHGLTLVTRNIADVEDTAVPLLTPWKT